MHDIETIASGETVLAYVIRGRASATSTQFITHPDANMQAGFVVYPKGGCVQAHMHLPVERHVTGTAEYILVRSGRCTVDVFDQRRAKVTAVELQSGDAILTLGGGHSVTMHEDTVLLELKQGPYFEGSDKERFEPSSDRPRT